MRKIKSLLLVLSIILCFSSAQAADKKIVKWKMQAMIPIGTTLMKIGTEWAKAIEKLTDGRLQIKIYPPGAMCGPKDIVNYLEKGAFDVAVTYGGYYTGIIPEAYLETGLPMGHQSYDEVWDAMYNRGLGEIISEAYSEHNIKWYPTAADVYYHFLTTFPVNTLEDIEGKKLRAAGVFGKYVQALGGSPTMVPGAEMYMALKLGTVDGAIYGYSGIQDIKLHEVVDYITMPTAAQIACSFLINQKSLEKLPKDLRVIVEEGTRYIMSDVSNRYTTEVKASTNKAIKDGSIKVNILPEEELVKMRAKVKPIWDEIAAMSPRMKKGIDILKQQMRDVGRPMD